MEQTHIKSFGLRLVLARHVITPRDLLSFWGKVNGTISQNPSANFARSLNVVHSAVISKGSYLGEAYATNINWINNSAISVAGYKLGNGSVNYAVFGFS